MFDMLFISLSAPNGYKSIEVQDIEDNVSYVY
jgi:hypothetical protein